MIDKRILLVDPISQRLKEAATGLKKLRAIPLMAKDGNEALHLLETEDPDLILCDSSVQGHSSLELCDYVHEFVHAVPFVLLVDKKPGVDPEKLRIESGADAVLTRPVNADQLINLTQLLNRIAELNNRIKHLEDENNSLREGMRQKNMIDPSTGFYRFVLFREVIVLEVKKAKRYEYPLSILLMAFDNFQQVSGYLTMAQRKAMYSLSHRAVTAVIRDIDIPLLFAEEKILIVLPHTALDGAAVVADRIRDQIVGFKPPKSLANLKLSVSISVASTENEESPTFGSMIKASMRALKEAEIKGGDVVLVCRPSQSADDKKNEQDSGDEPGGKLGPRTYFV